MPSRRSRRSLKVSHTQTSVPCGTLNNISTPQWVDIIMKDVGNSPHTLMTSPKGPIQGWDSPVTSPPPTPFLDIPCYYTVEYQAKRKAMNLPEAVPYQGPIDEEDPLPPHLSPDQPQWGTVTNRNTPPFQLMDYLDSICSNITPPIFMN